MDSQQPQEVVGGGPVLHELVRASAEFRTEFIRVASRQVESTEEKFNRLAHKWREDSTFCSSAHEMAMHPAYQEIIGLGQPAIPLILSALARAPDHWFWALSAITGVNPIRDDERGMLPKMADAWLTWGRLMGYLQP